jgi:RimJ/RimL family protein N-acetyltransferase
MTQSDLPLHRLEPNGEGDAMAKITIRKARESDLEAFYQHQLNPEYNRMAAFGSANPEDEIAFMDHKNKILRNPTCLFYAIELNLEPIGNIGSFFFDGERDLGYGIAKEHWGRGFATQAVQAFLLIEQIRPLGARAAAHNPGSIRVLEKCGFTFVKTEHGFSDFLQTTVEEKIFSLV